MTKLRRAAAGAALILAFAAPAKADLLAVTDTFIYNGTPALSVMDYVFNVASATPAVATLFDNTISSQRFLFLQLTIARVGDGTMGITTQAGSGPNPTSFSFTAAPGSYKATVLGVPGALNIPNLPAGLSFGAGTYGVTVAAVPEPEVWAMMLVGAGLVGYQLRRKARAASAAAIG